VEYTIDGELSQVVGLSFEAGETCWASKGSLITYSPEISWELKIPGGVGGAARRVLAGEGVTLTYIEANQTGQEVMLSANQPGKIIAWDLAEGDVVTTRGSFVAAFGTTIQIDVMTAKRKGAAFFGGAGLFLQKISGQGTVLIHGSGDFIEEQLAPGESMLVSTGNLAAFSESIDYNIESVSGLRRVLFGGEGLFMTKLTGPGRVLLQSLKRGAGASSKSV
jgi:uncharacterized protein (TIGR00266 family)